MKPKILHPLVMVTLIGVFHFNQSCSVMCDGFGKGCEKEKASSSKEVGQQAPASGGQPTAHGAVVALPPKETKQITEYVPGEGYALTRLTPEQFSHQIENSLGFSYSYVEPTSNIKVDLINTIYGVSLGGIDFTSTTKRDLSIKAQTLLATRLVAWEMARAAVFTDLGRAEADRLLFTQCKLEQDRPFVEADLNESAAVQDQIRQGELRWNKQVEDLFWRLYSRPPSDVEIAAVKTAFIASFTSEAYLPTNWLAIVYALMSTQEFWNL